jgi:hypothetical protein
MYFEIRTQGDPLALANTVRKITHEASPRVPVADLKTQSHQIEETIVQQRAWRPDRLQFGRRRRF